MCCPVCPTANTKKGGCFIDDKLVKDGESASLIEDKCSKCTCVVSSIFIYISVSLSATLCSFSSLPTQRGQQLIYNVSSAADGIDNFTVTITR
jgi:hypothetical protein